MRLLLVNPNISESVTRLIHAEAERSAAPGTQIMTATAEFGVAYIETRAEAVIAAYATLDLLAREYPGHDAAIIAAFGDPGIGAAREALPIPVVGLTEAALASACLVGSRFSVVTVSRRIRAWYREVITACGLIDRVASLRPLEDPLSDIGNIQADHGERLLGLCEAAVEEDGADAIILAGAPLAGLARSVAARLPVPVIDGVASAVHHAHTLAAMELAGHAAGSFAPPPKKPCTGLSPALTKLVGRERLDGGSEE